MCLKSAIFLLFITSAASWERQITSSLNPGCPDCSDNENNVTLIYIKEVGSKDTIHQIWDFTGGIPTVIFAISALNSTLSITWNGTKPIFFNSSHVITYSFAAYISDLMEYNDVADVGELDPGTARRSYPLRPLRWERQEIALTAEQVALHVRADQYLAGQHWRNGTISLKLELLPYTEYARQLPHLIHSANSTLLDVSLVNMTTSPRFNSSRFGLVVALASTDKMTDSMAVRWRKSLDDEHTPGIFEIVEIQTPESVSSGDGGYVQFRPVAYVRPERGVTTSTSVYVGKLNRTSLPDGTARRFFAGNGFDKVLVESSVISIGSSGDGFYASTQYAAWSLMVGYGSPPAEAFSLFVKLVIGIGVGVPVAMLVSGVAYVTLRRRKQLRNAHARLDN